MLLQILMKKKTIKNTMILTQNHSDSVKLVLNVMAGLDSALGNVSKLDSSMTSMESLCGFSGESFRHFMNNMGSIPGLNYLEVGSYCGSTLFSLLHKNLGTVNKAYAIDNWCQFNEVGNPKDAFFTCPWRHAFLNIFMRCRLLENCLSH